MLLSYVAPWSPLLYDSRCAVAFNMACSVAAEGCSTMTPELKRPIVSLKLGVAQKWASGERSVLRFKGVFGCAILRARTALKQCI